MPSVIADTSPLQYLHQVGCLGLLGDLFGCVIVPAGVAQEIRQGALQGVDLPDLGQLPWVTIETASAPADSRIPSKLGHGEREVLCWALQTQDPLVLLDDGEARKQAKSLGIRFTGTLGVLIKARHAGKVAAVLPLLDQLEQAGFYIDAPVRTQVLASVGESP
jgi:predicted nucleic acid-binding protein